MENDDFADVSWQSPPRGNTDGAGGSSSGAAAAGEAQPRHAKRIADVTEEAPRADPLDNAGIGNGHLECTVTAPLKEGDGSKDSYVSYLVTTNVCIVSPRCVGEEDLADRSRPISLPSKSRRRLFGGDSRISSSCIIPSTRNTRSVRSRLCRISIA